jgi:hypothetical protein
MPYKLPNNTPLDDLKPWFSIDVKKTSKILRCMRVKKKCLQHEKIRYV